MGEPFHGRTFPKGKEKLLYILLERQLVTDATHGNLEVHVVSSFNSIISGGFISLPVKAG